MEKKKWINSNGNFWNGISVVIGDMRIWNPTDEQLIEAGFTEYIPPVEPEPTQEELFNRAKNDKLVQIDNYDKSVNVNGFFLGDNEMWLGVEERQQLATQISANEAIGRTEMTKYFHGIAYTFPLLQWKQMLVALEVYAGDALNITENHKAAVEALDTIEAIEAYDYTTGYPEKLVFEIPSEEEPEEENQE